jgi:putative acyl-CoA dehydrogenase
VQTIIDMVHHTRLDTMAGSLGLMRAGLAQAAHHVRHRRAFQRTLIDQPAMRAVIADLHLEYEAAVLLTLFVARLTEDPAQRGFARLAVAIGKYLLSKRCPGFVYECLECLGGAGFIEEGPMPRLYREAPLNAIWEGTGNVIALDVLRTLAKEPAAFVAWRQEIGLARGGNRLLDAAASRLEAEIIAGVVDQGRARWIAEALALCLQAALLVRHGVPAVADAFCASRFGEQRAGLYGNLPNGCDLGSIVARAG